MRVQTGVPQPTSALTAADKAALIRGIRIMVGANRRGTIMSGHAAQLVRLIEQICNVEPAADEQQVLLMIVLDTDGTMQIVPNNGDPVPVPEHALVTVHPGDGEVHFRVGVTNSIAPWDVVRAAEKQNGGDTPE